MRNTVLTPLPPAACTYNMQLAKHSVRYCLPGDSDSGVGREGKKCVRFGTSAEKKYLRENIKRRRDVGTGMRLERAKPFWCSVVKAKKKKKCIYVCTRPHFGRNYKLLKWIKRKYIYGLSFVFIAIFSDPQFSIVGFRRFHYNVCNPFFFCILYKW